LPFLVPVVFLGRRSGEDRSQQMKVVDNVAEVLTLVDVGEDTTLGDGDVAQELVQLLVIADGELKVTRDNTCLLVVASGVASQLEDLSSQVLKDSCEVDGSA
jgi:hypothetical protein